MLQHLIPDWLADILSYRAGVVRAVCIEVENVVSTVGACRGIVTVVPKLDRQCINRGSPLMIMGCCWVLHIIFYPRTETLSQNLTEVTEVYIAS